MASTPSNGKNERPIAVALKYEPGSGNAPRVAASGQGAVAEQILELAFANGIRVREDPDLAAILATVEVDSIIPLEAFAAVAEIIAYLYQVNAIARPGSEPAPPSDQQQPLPHHDHVALSAASRYRQPGQILENAPDYGLADEQNLYPGQHGAAGRRYTGQG